MVRPDALAGVLGGSGAESRFPTTDDGVIMAHHSVIASHRTIRDALLDQAVTVLHGALRG